MKKSLWGSCRGIATIAVLMLSIATHAVAQDRNNEDEVVKIDARASQSNYRPNEVIVKFKPAATIKMRTNAKGSFTTSGVSKIDNLLHELEIETVDELMPYSGKETTRRSARAINGQEIVAKDLSKLYRLRLASKSVQSVYEAIEKLEAIDEVEFAEPNYLIYTTAKDDEELIYSDPLHGEQWGINAVNLRKLWKVTPITDKRPVIGILDTGVEINHPDLIDNAWINEIEYNGVEGVDDDNNGFIDDIHGWDFVNQTNRIDDYNGHGTHCAGIAAAMAGNDKGGVGANPNAQIMSIGVMQSDGVGDIATIIKGIDYATANGVDVLSMSIGTYAESVALEQALGKAYQKAVLVAAAGNDYKCIYAHNCPVNKKTAIQNGPMFPAAFSFVLGVEASKQDGSLASFSNFDEDGPVFSTYSEEQLYNYELRAPGAQIMSTFRGGSYKALNGTSMACPIVAGGISRLLQCKEYDSKELLFGDLIHAANGGMVDFYATYQITDNDRQPTLQLITYELNDTIGGDGDMRADAGETIEFYPTLRNNWGQAKNIKISLEIAENEDPTIIEFIENSVDYGANLSSYAKGKASNPIRFKLRDDCVDGRHICLVLRATCDNIQEELVHEFVITAENGVEIGGMITEDLTLYPNVHYIVTQPLAIPNGVTLTIKPGTVLKFKDNTGISCAGNINCVGTPDSMIVFTKTDLGYGIVSKLRFSDPIKYVKFSFLSSISVSSAQANEHFFHGNYENCIFENCTSNYPYLFYESNLNYCNIYNNMALWDGLWFEYADGQATKFTGTNICSNLSNAGLSIAYNAHAPQSLFSCNIYDNRNYYSRNKNDLTMYRDVPTIIKFGAPSYLGSDNEDIIREGVLDMYHKDNPIGFAMIDLSDRLTRPSSKAHGIVWKVVVNGYDAQDEFEQLAPLGVGKHKFEVYFNRPMDVSKTPMLTMGVRPPYTQHTIAEEGFWSEDSLVYTAYLTITGKTNTDGLNRIYVAEAEDNEHFEIPLENMRFNVEVAAAGSMATGLMAEAGLGKVTLTWETDEEDFADLLGYNIYRYTDKLDSVYVEWDEKGNWVGQWKVVGDTTIVNNNVLESSETTFTDYDVVPGTTYYYVIKQLTTSLTSHALSNAVAATPLTATKGDANGSMSVDVADVVTEVAYMTYQDPQPFIFEAADVITDSVINVLDVVGTVNIIKTPAGAMAMSVDNSAIYTIEDGILYVESYIPLGGVQFRFNVGEYDEIIPLEALDGFETVSDDQGDNGYLFFAFSMSGKVLPTGKHALLQIGNAEITEVVLSDATGKNVVAIDGKATGLGTIEAMQMVLPYPNPFDEVLTIPYKIGKEGRHDVKIVVSTIAGSRVAEHNVSVEYGEYSWNWYAGESVYAGVYFVSLYVDDKLMQTAKVVKK